MSENDKKTKVVEEETIKKHELSGLLDTSYPLLQQFREACPGTYKHAQSLASMMDGISVALNLDVTFMKVCAFYHDVGKMLNPKYFTENQLKDENLHDKLDPWISYQIITRHVADTASILINDHNFPRDLIEIVSRHHGTCVLQYFFDKSKSKNQEDYRYKGSKPTSVEAAVLMIADHVEAASRSLFQSGKLDQVDVIDVTVNSLIDDGQLDDVVMKLGDLKKIKDALAKELEGSYQKRVDYDKAKEED
jgi:putative nucleotidyltransferase with HDIG domain